MAHRTYFPGLESLTDRLVKYYTKYGFKLPTDLRSAIDLAFTALDAADLVIKLWDFAHAGGHPST